MVLASSPPKCLDQDCVGRRRTGTRRGNVYRSVREKQGNDIVYRQRALQTVASLRVVSLVVNLRNRTGEERRRQTFCDKRDNNFA